MKTERKFLIGFGVAFLMFVVYLVWPREFDPPLKGLGKPVWEGQFGATHRYLYNFSGDYATYVQNAANHLKFNGYRIVQAGYRYFSHPDGSWVMIYPGRWRSTSTHGDFVDTYVPGWVTVSCCTPPDPWRQLWFQLTHSFHRKPTSPSASRGP